MAFVHGWKELQNVPAPVDTHVEAYDGGHLHNAVSGEVVLTFDGDEGHKVYDKLESAWRDEPSVYAHVSCLGNTILHEDGARCTQYPVDYFIEAFHAPELAAIAEKLNIAILPADKDGCPVCRGDATEDEKAEWFGEGYGR